MTVQGDRRVSFSTYEIAFAAGTGSIRAGKSEGSQTIQPSYVFVCRSDGNCLTTLEAS